MDFRYAQLPLPDRTVEPVRWIEHVLLTASICDGYPDPRDHYLAVQYPGAVREGRAIEAGPAPQSRIARLSSARIRLLFAGRLDQTLW